MPPSSSSGSDFGAGAGRLLGSNDLQSSIDRLNNTISNLTTAIQGMASTGMTTTPAMASQAEGATFSSQPGMGAIPARFTGGYNAAYVGQGAAGGGANGGGRGGYNWGQYGGDYRSPTGSAAGMGYGPNGYEQYSAPAGPLMSNGGFYNGGNGILGNMGAGGTSGQPGPGTSFAQTAVQAAGSFAGWAQTTGMGQLNNQLLFNAYGTQMQAQWGGSAQTYQNAAFGNGINGMNNYAAAGNAQGAAQEFGTLTQLAGGANVTSTAAFAATNALALTNQGMGAAAASQLAAQIYNPVSSLQMRMLTGVSAYGANGQQNSLASIIGGLASEGYLGGGNYNSKTGTFKQSALNASFTPGRGTSYMNLQALGYSGAQIQDIQAMMSQANQIAVKGHTSLQNVLNTMNEAEYGSQGSSSKALGQLHAWDSSFKLSTLQNQGNQSAINLGQQQSQSSTYNDAVNDFTNAMTKATNALNWFLDKTGLNKVIGGVQGAGAGWNTSGAGSWASDITGLVKAAIGGGASSVSVTQPQTSQGRSAGSSMSSVPPQVATAVKDAEAQVGKPYVYGGDSPATSFDCSGLVQWAYGQAGVHLARTSEEQWAELKNRSVSLDKVREGDIVFTAGSDGTIASPGHEALMISSNQIVEAPYCVPIDTEILTRRGWVKYDSLYTDDETLGYNLETDRLEWTPIFEAHVFEDVPVVKAGNKHWQVEATDNHRWVVRSQYQRKHGLNADLTPLNEITQGSSMILSAPADTPEGLNITDVEAELLAWAEGDGSIRVRGGTLELNITQSNPEWVGHLQSLLAEIPHTETVRKVDPRARNAQHVWYFPAVYARDLLDRAGYLDGPESMLLSMSPAQREAWLRGMWGADGSKTRKSSTMVITQNDGPVQDAIALCMYLLGYRPRYWKREPGRRIRKVTATNPRLFVQSSQFSVEPSRSTDVWCPTTGLGTWTARQGDHIFVTGNTGADIRIRSYNPGEWQHAARPVGSTSGSTGAATPVSGTARGYTGGSQFAGNSGGMGDSSLGLTANADSMLFGGGTIGAGPAPGGLGSSGNGGSSNSTTSNTGLQTGATGGTLSPSQIEKLWTSEGGPASAAANMARIAMAESGDKPDTKQQGEPPGLTGWGLYQITPTSGIQQNGQFGNLLNAANNTKAAIYLFKKDGYAPWSADPVGAQLTGMATGGPIVVGERGPELFVPEKSGNLLSAAQTTSLLRGTSAQAAQAPYTATPAQQLMYDMLSPANNTVRTGSNAGVSVSIGQVTVNAPNMTGTSTTSDVQVLGQLITAQVEKSMAQSTLINQIRAGVTD